MGLIFLAFVLIIGIFIGFTLNKDSNTENNTNPNIMECPDGNFLANLTCECPTGFVRTGSAFLTFQPMDYCKVDMEWEEFELCKKQEDCAEGYGCTSTPDFMEDLRCVPPQYQMPCSCKQGEGCWCS